MLLTFIIVVVGLIFGPIAWRYSDSPERTRRWIIAAYLGLAAIVPLRLIQLNWPKDNGENYGLLLMILPGTPLAAAASAVLLVCLIRGRQSRSPATLGFTVAGILLACGLVGPLFLR